MPDIIHRIEISTSLEKTFLALSTEQGLKGWWTNDVTMTSKGVGGIIKFRFNSRLLICVSN